MKVKTKLDKHTNDNEKRKNALKEKAKIKSSQADIIKQALSMQKLHTSSSKKITFAEENEVSEGKSFSNDKPALFSESDSDLENLEIKEKAQFQGKKGYELLKIQSNYGNDERFKIDERFIEEDEMMSGMKTINSDFKENNTNEKSKHLEILDDTLNHSKEEEKKKKKWFEMVRYDESNKDHERYEIKSIKSELDKAELGKKRKERKLERSVKEKKPKVEVSKEKFYEVSKDIKDSFKENTEQSGGFSLLQTYGHEKDIQDDRANLDSEMEEEESAEKQLNKSDSDSNDESSEHEEYRIVNNTERKTVKSTEEVPLKAATAAGIWKETFFFASDDPRFKEGLEFINKKNSDEANKVAENYDATRKILKEILRLHTKKQLQRKNPFKKKIGGMSKKQMANSKFKNNLPKRFNKRKSVKLNPGKRP